MAMRDQLQAAGVTTIGINTENGQGMTPGDEMATLNSADPQVNIVARVATARDREWLQGDVGAGAGHDG